MTYPTFPTIPGIAWPVHRKPTFRTLVAKHSSGADVRDALWPYSLWEFELSFADGDGGGLTADSTSYPGLGAQTLQTLMGFYLSVGGAADAFLFVDPENNSAIGYPVAVGDGTTTEFVVTREVGTSTEPVSYLTSATVYLNGTVTSGVTLQGNMLVFATAPANGVEISADYAYAFLCHFLDDEAEFEQMMVNLWSSSSLKFRQVATS